LKRMTWVMAVILLLAVAAAAAFADRNAGVPGGDIGVGQTHSLADGILDPHLA
jgi:hypothetical protein